ncbi:MAG TPA: GerMN domain-containing protein [Acidimicrobiales bacterium]|nr:GerMN domain-containing protein [Acidimicrobiales bacterium]
MIANRQRTSLDSAGPVKRGRPRAGPYRRARLAGALVIGSCVLASGCGLGPQAAPTPLSRHSLPRALLFGLARTTTTVLAAPASTVALYLEGSDQHLVMVHRRVGWPATPSEVLAALAAGPTPPESDRGLVSPASSVGALVAGYPHQEVVPVYVPLSFESLSGEDQVMAAAQIVYSVTSLPGVKGVVFLVGRQRTQVPNDQGDVTAGPLTRLDYASLR